MYYLGDDVWVQHWSRWIEAFKFESSKRSSLIYCIVITYLVLDHDSAVEGLEECWLHLRLWWKSVGAAPSILIIPPCTWHSISSLIIPPCTQRIMSVAYEDQCASDLLNERITISSSEYSKLVLLYVVHLYDVQKIQHCWRTSYSHTHTRTFVRDDSEKVVHVHMYKRQKILVYDRAYAPKGFTASVSDTRGRLALWHNVYGSL